MVRGGVEACVRDPCHGGCVELDSGSVGSRGRIHPKPFWRFETYCWGLGPSESDGYVQGLVARNAEDDAQIL